MTHSGSNWDFISSHVMYSPIAASPTLGTKSNCQLKQIIGCRSLNLAPAQIGQLGLVLEVADVPNPFCQQLAMSILQLLLPDEDEDHRHRKPAATQVAQRQSRLDSHRRQYRDDSSIAGHSGHCLVDKLSEGQAVRQLRSRQ